MTSRHQHPGELTLFWAKYDQSGLTERPKIHPLCCHMVDVAAVASAMRRMVLPPAACRALSAKLSVPEEHAEKWIAFWAGLHDLGKASPAFQFKLDHPEILSTHHGTITTATPGDILTKACSFAQPLASGVATLVGGHHMVPHLQDRSPRK